MEMITRIKELIREISVYQCESVIQTKRSFMYKYSNITEKIIGSAMKVHSALGNGFQEVIYQRALMIEMQKRGLSFEREKEQTIFYDGIDIGTRRVDFLVEGKILVELKAIENIESIHCSQVLNYLTAFNLEIALLINFGETKLVFKRFVK